jgi:hypothetical protein
MLKTIKFFERTDIGSWRLSPMSVPVFVRYPSLTLSCHKCYGSSEYFFLRPSGVIRCRTMWTIYGKNSSLVNWNKGDTWRNIPSKITYSFTYKGWVVFSCCGSCFSKRLLKDLEMLHSCRISIALLNKTNPEPNGRSFAEICGPLLQPTEFIICSSSKNG